MTTGRLAAPGGPSLRGPAARPTDPHPVRTRGASPRGLCQNKVSSTDLMTLRWAPMSPSGGEEITGREGRGCHDPREPSGSGPDLVC